MAKVLEAKMEEFLSYVKYETPRDRNSDFELQIVKKRQTILG